MTPEEADNKLAGIEVKLKRQRKPTGLKDKNGKEIYEGDIVFSDKFASQSKEVYWDNDHACWRIPRTDDLEIIGNIYENPELLKRHC
jgi:hypothetical protein